MRKIAVNLTNEMKNITICVVKLVPMWARHVIGWPVIVLCGIAQFFVLLLVLAFYGLDRNPTGFAVRVVDFSMGATGVVQDVLACWMELDGGEL